ncbi:MAG: hypothetical protein WC455_02740 [Dehalococcoidia bacterium]|jgi:endo-1,4-beta-D-glucanase Y
MLPTGTPQTVTVTGVNDFVMDGNISYTIVTAAASSSNTSYNYMNAADVGVTNNDNDVAGITVTPTSGLVTTEAGGTDAFTIKLNTQPTANVVIGLTSNDSTEGTVSPASVTFTTTTWDTWQTVTVTGIDDAVDDDDISYKIVTAAATSGDTKYSGKNADDVSVTNTDDDTAGVTVNPTSGLFTSESGSTATFTIVLDTQPMADVSIGLSSNDDTEGNVSPAGVTFTTANWNTPKTVIITGGDDDIEGDDIVYSIVTAAAVSGDTKYSGLDADNVTVTNNDNDTAGITVNPTVGLVTTEAGGTATFTIRLNKQPAHDVFIAWSSSNLAEGTVSPPNVTFTSANWNTPRTVTVTGVDDALTDGNISYTIVTAAASSTDGNYSGWNAADISVTNIDNDIPGITVNPTSGLVTTEAGGTATFTVKLNTQPTANVSIGLSSSNLAEGTVSPSSITFSTANWSTPRTITVTGVNDAVADGDIAYTIVTAAATSTDTDYNNLNAADVSVTNTDNDTPGITVTPTAGLVTTEAGGTANFTIKLNAQPAANVVINLSSNDSTEGTVSPSSVTFSTANWSTLRIVAVTGVNDALMDGNISYSIITAAASSDDTDYNNLNAADVSVTNTDNDGLGISVNPASGLVTTEAGGTANFTIVLNNQPTDNVSIGLSSNDSTEGTVSPSSVTFSTANWSTPRTITVTGVNDALIDGNISYTIVTAAASSTDANYNGLDAADVSVTNTDNDAVGISVNPASGLVTTEAGGTANFTIVLNTQPTANVVINLSSSDTGEGTISLSSVTFNTSNWSTPRTVTITGVNDALVDGNIAYTIVTAASSSTDANYSGLNAADVSVTNTDTPVPAPTPTISFDIGGAKASLNISSSGVIQQAVNVTSADDNISMHIQSGTTALNDQGQPLSELNMSTTDDHPAASGNRSVIAAFDFEPDGATFNPGIVVTFHYTHDMIPAGVNESRLIIGFYNESSDGWEYPDCVVNTAANTITFTVYHFTKFTIQTPPIRQESAGLSTWVIILISFFAAVVLGLAAGLYIKRRRIYGSLYYENGEGDEYYPDNTYNDEYYPDNTDDKGFKF